jgi:hypothetical protein
MNYLQVIKVKKINNILFLEDRNQFLERTNKNFVIVALILSVFFIILALIGIILDKNVQQNPVPAIIICFILLFVGIYLIHMKLPYALSLPLTIFNDSFYNRYSNISSALQQRPMKIYFNKVIRVEYDDPKHPINIIIQYLNNQSKMCEISLKTPDYQKEGIQIIFEKIKKM